MNFSPTLGLPLLSENQSGKEATINTAFSKMEAALQGTYQFDFVNDAYTLTNLEASSYFRYIPSNIVANSVVTFPQDTSNGAPEERYIILSNFSPDYSITVEGDLLGSVTVQPFTTVFLYISEAGIENMLLSAPFVGRISDLVDVDTTGLTDGQYLVYDVDTLKWVPTSFEVALNFVDLEDTPNTIGDTAGRVVIPDGTTLSYSTLDLDFLSDVDLTTLAPTDGQVLVFNETDGKWVPQTVEGVSSDLDSLSDVDLTTTSPTDGQVLTYRSSDGQWVPKTVEASSGDGGSGGGAVSPVIEPANRWRLFIHDSYDQSGDVRAGVSEIRWMDEDGITISIGGTPSASSVSGPNFEATRAYDSDTSTYWATTQGDKLDSWIAYQFTSDVVPSSVGFIPPQAPYVDYAPRLITIQQSTDNGATWKDVGHQRIVPYAEGVEQVVSVKFEYVTEAPADGDPYVRQNEEWVPASAPQFVAVTDFLPLELSNGMAEDGTTISPWVSVEGTFTAEEAYTNAIPHAGSRMFACGGPGGPNANAVSTIRQEIDISPYAGSQDFRVFLQFFTSSDEAQGGETEAVIRFLDSNEQFISSVTSPRVSQPANPDWSDGSIDTVIPRNAKRIEIDISSINTSGGNNSGLVDTVYAEFTRSSLRSPVTSASINAMMSLSQAEYDSLGFVDRNTLYVIV